ncbi:MAG: hypothetical protein ACE368_17365 [Paracoccaceae bacterium]|jgi:predicted PurR-regulated permease PerM
MYQWVRKFIFSDDGAVTADFVVVTAAIVGLGLAVMMTFADGFLDTTENVNTRVENYAPPTFPDRAD